MASIYKLKSTRSLPHDADVVTNKGERFIRLKRGGRTVLRPLTECGTKYRDESKKWYIKYKDENGQWQQVPGYSDKDATIQMSAQLERRRDHVQSGLADRQESGTLRPLSEHLDDFRQFLKDKSNSTDTRITIPLSPCVSASRRMASFGIAT